MTWALIWHPAASRGLLYIPSTSAAGELCAAAKEYARTGEGPVAQLIPPDERRLYLFVPGAGALLFLDPIERTVRVMRVFRR
jgi:hypothetical protein